MLNYLKRRGYSLFPALPPGSRVAVGAENFTQGRVRDCEGGDDSSGWRGMATA